MTERETRGGNAISISERKPICQCVLRCFWGRAGWRKGVVGRNFGRWVGVKPRHPIAFPALGLWWGGGRCFRFKHRGVPLAPKTQTHQSTCDSWSARRSLMLDTVFVTEVFTAFPTRFVTTPIDMTAVCRYLTAGNRYTMPGCTALVTCSFPPSVRAEVYTQTRARCHLSLSPTRL
jgi:hypothetical protein